MMGRFSFIQISDHHIMATADSLWRGFCTAYSFVKVMEHIAEHHAAEIDFIVSTGDITFHGTAEEYACFARRAALRDRAHVAHPPPGVHASQPRAAGPHQRTLGMPGLEGVPIYLIPGNHDEPAAMARTLYSGAAPESFDYAFTHKGVRFICIDSGRAWQAPLAEAALKVVRENLSETAPAVVLTHINPELVPGLPWIAPITPENVAALWDLFEDRNVLAFLYGHIHRDRETEIRGVPAIGAWATAFQLAEAPRALPSLEKPCYRVVTIEDGVLSHQVCEVPIEWGSVEAIGRTEGSGA